MQDKQKVTLYLTPGLHRKLKIRAAVDTASMSMLVERAIVFCLNHPEIVEEVERAFGETHKVYSCPACDTATVLKEGELIALAGQPGILAEDRGMAIEKVREGALSADSQEEEQLVPC